MTLYRRVFDACRIARVAVNVASELEIGIVLETIPSAYTRSRNHERT